jgi:uncharacterized membrane protein
MVAFRVVVVIVALILIGLVAAYVFSGNKRYLSMAARLGVAVAGLLVLFFAVLAFQNWG